MKKIPVILIDKNERFISSILSFLRKFPNLDSIKFSNNVIDLEEILVKKKPAIVFIGTSYSLAEMEDLLNLYNHSLSYVKIVLLSSEITSDLLKNAIKLDIHDVIESPFSEDDLKKSIDRALHLFYELEEDEEKDIQNCKKIMFFSTKGGAGNTFLAVNFAVAARLKTKSEVIIYDLNYQFGDVAIMLNIYPKNTVFDLAALDKFDLETLKIFLAIHNTGLKVLPSPIDPTQGETIKYETSVNIFESLTKISDYLIIDAPFGFTDVVLTFMERVDYMFIVASKDVTSVKNLKICLQIFEKIKYPDEKVYIVLNREDSKVDIETEEIEKTINRKIDIKVPSDRIVPISINKGVPAVVSFLRSPIVKNIYRMTDILLKSEEKEKSKVLI